MTAAKATTVLLSEAEIDRLELRLQNWVKWSKANSAGVKRCGSAEGRYLAVSVDDEGFASKVELESIDHIDGELVDQAVIALPTTADRAYLFMHYLKGRSEKYIATRMRLTVDQMGDRHVQTLMQLAPLLAAIERPHLIARGRRIWAGLDVRKLSGHKCGTI
ncbi:MAG TPA: hypothetical protein VIR56_06785 [Solimonas sp.]